MTIGERLKEERERLEFAQPAFAAIAGTTKKSQIDYEKDVTQPKAGYLAAIAKIGADVQYIVTGSRSAATTLSSDEMELLSLFRSAPLGVKAAAIGALKGGTLQGNAAQIFHSEIRGGVAGRDIVHNKERK